MPFSYNKLWKLLIDKNMNKVALRDAIGITPATLSKMSKNQTVSMDVLAKVCKELDCYCGHCWTAYSGIRRTGIVSI